MSGPRPRSKVESGALALTLALAVTMGMVCPASGQSLDQGRLTGLVTDSTGRVLPGVRVTLTADDVKRSVVTSEEGIFAFDGVGPETAHTIGASRPAGKAGSVSIPNP